MGTYYVYNDVYVIIYIIFLEMIKIFFIYKIIYHDYLILN